MKGNAETFRDVAELFVVANNGWYLTVELTGVVPLQDIVETMAGFADKEDHLRLPIRKLQLPLHIISCTNQGGEVLADLFLGDQEVCQVPFYPHEKMAHVVVNVLVEVEDIASIFMDEFGDQGDKPRLVRTVDK